MLMKFFAVSLALLVAAAVAWSTVTRTGYPEPSDPATRIDTASGTTALPALTTAARHAAGSLEVTDPKPNAVVSSPLAVAGRATESWFANGRLAIVLMDAAGNIVTHAPAEGVWAEQDAAFIPFALTLQFEMPTTTTSGLLVIRNENPSGDPSLDLLFAIPVRFSH